MRTSSLGFAFVVALTAASAVAPTSAQAAAITHAGWAFGGGFVGPLVGRRAYDTSHFNTDCIELELSFSLSRARQ
jgi:hypothetical protein